MYDKLLVSLDGSDLAELVVPDALELAKCCGSKVTLLQTVKSVGQQEAAQEYLTSVAAKITAEGVEVSWAVVSDAPAEAILQYADKDGSQHIAMASHGRAGLNHMLHTSVAEDVIHGATVPVYYVRSIHEHRWTGESTLRLGYSPRRRSALPTFFGDDLANVFGCLARFPYPSVSVSGRRRWLTQPYSGTEAICHRPVVAADVAAKPRQQQVARPVWSHPTTNGSVRRSAGFLPPLTSRQMAEAPTTVPSASTSCEMVELSKDPLFIEKVRDIAGLYLNPSERALVLCVDE